MPDKDFEKQVQQKMDELQFIPSEAVWQKLEKEISGAKRRRLLFLWLPLVLLVLGGSVYLAGIKNTANKNHQGNERNAPLAVKNHRQQNAVSNSEKDKPSALEAHTATAIIEKKIPPAANYPVPATQSRKTDNTAALNDADHNAISVRPPARSMAGTVDKTVHKKDNTGMENTGLAQKGEDKMKILRPAGKKAGVPDQAQNPVAAEKTVIATETMAPQNENNRTGADSGVAANKTAADAVVAINPDTKDSIKNTKATDSSKGIAKTNPARKTKKKMEWGLSLTTGVSGISKGLSGLLSVTRSTNMASLSPQNNFSGRGNINSSYAAFTTPSDTRNSFAFAAGAFISKPVNKTSRLLAGLNYRYSGTRIELGPKMNSSGGAVQYFNGRSASYTNRFHFIELPVVMEKQLGTASRFSINGGFAFSLLAGSSALLYDQQKNIYYTDNSNIHKTQLGLLAGFSYRLLQRSFQLEIGPQFNYNTGNIFKKDLYGSRHLLFAGISTKIFFGKK